MTDHLQHICTESECCYTGQPSPKGCGCHQTREQMSAARIERLEAINAELLEALEALQRQALQSPDLIKTEWGQEALNLSGAAIARAKALEGEAGNGAP